MSAKRAMFHSLLRKLRPSARSDHGMRTVRPFPVVWAIARRKRVGAVLADQVDRIDAVALRLRHLLALVVDDERRDVDGAERHVAHEVERRHDHPRHPEEQDVERREQERRREERLEIVRLLRPTHHRERPQPRREPRVEHVLVLPQRRRPRRSGRAPPRSPRPPSGRRTRARPGPYHTGIRWPHHSCREMHQSRMFSSQSL